MAIRNILDSLGNIIGSLLLPDETTEDQWTQQLSQYSSSPSSSVLNPSHYHGTNSYSNTQILTYTNSATTDSNGRVTFNLTVDGTTSGIPLFTTILFPEAIGVDNSGTAIQAPLFFIESLTSTQIIFRGVRGTSTGVLIGGTVVSAQFIGSGYTCYIQVKGIK